MFDGVDGKKVITLFGTLFVNAQNLLISFLVTCNYLDFVTNRCDQARLKDLNHFMFLKLVAKITPRELQQARLIKQFKPCFKSAL